MRFKIHYEFFLEIKKNKTIYYPEKIINKHGDVICLANGLYFFLELLSSFVANQLNPEKTYELIYKDINGGFKGKIVRKNKIHYLKIDVGEKSYYLEKYDCRVIYSYTKSILSKCTYKEFLEEK
jgi:hypothetical protein